MRSGLHFAAADTSRPPVVHGAEVRAVRGYSFTGLAFDRGFRIDRSKGVVVEHSSFAGAGIYVRQSSDVTISANRIRRLRGTARGIMLQGSSTTGAPDNERIRIVGNAISDTDHDAIGVYNGYSDLRIANNRIRDVHQPPGFAYHSDGLQLTGGDHATIEGNVLQDVTHGIIVKDGAPTTRLVVRRNLVARVGGAALQLYNAPGAVIRQNTFWNALLGVVLGNASTVDGATRVRLDDNVLLDLTTRSAGAVASAGGNVFGRGRTVGRPAYRGRPRFVDAAAGDYRLRGAAPGAGIRAGSVVPGAQLRTRP
ncbi:right-handed parallel beta-helix repeat-containing protein [Patulibacter minatonensis]|uniref:right-handed parallel beta-helix repeat-containing protein n=1 Tax=Patulibacter minatonensis TaxID=298163 RepID=UPI00047B3A9D|nr:right-handed parallel beta-helix repeat-containing protein [Patulibacter minatonensis]